MERVLETGCRTLDIAEGEAAVVGCKEMGERVRREIEASRAA